jgi:hypothetical protein
MHDNTLIFKCLQIFWQSELTATQFNSRTNKVHVVHTSRNKVLISFNAHQLSEQEELYVHVSDE